MPVLTTALLIGAGLGVAGKIAGGISAARQAKGMFSDEDARRLEALKRRRAQGELGLTGALRVPVTCSQRSATALVQRGAALRDMQALPMGAGAGNREMFLKGLGQQDAIAQARQASARDIQAMDVAAAEAQRQELSQLASLKSQSEAGRKAAFIQALGGAAEVAGQAVTAQAIRKDDLMQKAAAERAAVDAELGIAKELRTSLTQPPMAEGPLGTYSPFLVNPSSTWR